MGCVKTIDIDKFPVQGSFLNRRVNVCFNYNVDKTLQGVIVRDDGEEPYRCIIKLENGHYIEASECQFSFL